MKQTLVDNPVKIDAGLKTAPEVIISAEKKIVRRLSEEMEALKETIEKMNDEKMELIEASEIKVMLNSL